MACTISPIVATLLFLAWGGLGAWIFWTVRWSWWNAPPEAWVVVRERLRGWSVRWFLLLAAGMAAAAVAGTYDC